jgi:hypothetical protein
MGNFGETSPALATSNITLALAGTQATEVVIVKTKKSGTITDAWGMCDVAAAADGDVALKIINRGTAYTGTAIIATLNGAGTAWGATTPKVGTVANNTDIVADSYISAVVTRAAGSTATAHVLTVGIAFVPGSPAAVGAIDT